MPSEPRISTLLVALASLAPGCGRSEPPQSVRVELPAVVLTPAPLRVAVHVTDASGRSLQSERDHEIAVSPPDLAVVGKEGSVACRRSGDGSVTATVRGVSAAGPLRCRLVEKVEVPAPAPIEIAAGPFVPTIRLLGAGGKELGDVELSLTSKNPGVIFPRGKELVPKSVGAATLLVRAGEATGEFGVEVVRKLTPEALPIDGNRRLHFSLEPGKYRLTVDLPAPKRLTAEWRGAPYCDYAGTERHHAPTCVLRAKGGVVFDNPAFLRDGSTEVSLEGVTLHEVP